MHAHTCVYVCVCVCACTCRVSCVRVYMDLEYIVMNVLLSRKCGKFLDYITESLFFYCSRILLSSASEKCNGKYKIFPLLLKKMLFYLLYYAFPYYMESIHICIFKSLRSMSSFHQIVQSPTLSLEIMAIKVGPVF
jgi:hypothetical protein